jgi:hypothetical protein
VLRLRRRAPAPTAEKGKSEQDRDPQDGHRGASGPASASSCPRRP